MTASRRSLVVQFPAVGQTVIRGLVTYRLMVRREPCYLLSWITLKLCQHSNAADGSNLFVYKAPSRYRHFVLLLVKQLCCLNQLNCPTPHRAETVKGLPPQAVRSTLDWPGTVWHLCDVVRHHPPYETCQFPRHCCNCHIPRFPLEYKLIILSP